MRITHYIDSTDSRRGGPTRTVADCARILAANGHRVTILTSDTKDTPREWLDAESGGFGAGGEGFFRVSFIQAPERIAEAAIRAGRVLANLAGVTAQG